nr:hypothetical protein Iba_scaffold56400CG0020 [Ipomoea batatas]
MDSFCTPTNFVSVGHYQKVHLEWKNTTKLDPHLQGQLHPSQELSLKPLQLEMLNFLCLNKPIYSIQFLSVLRSTRR